MRLSPILAELAAKHGMSPTAVDELWTLLLLAEDVGRCSWQCAGCGSELCLRVKGGEDA